MRPIYENTVIHVDITNACYLKCTNCTRHVGHHNKPYFMDLDYVRKAIESLQDFPGRIGLMGGDPTLHPKFDEICEIYEEMIPRRQRELWTSGFKWKEKKDLCKGGQTYFNSIIQRPCYQRYSKIRWAI